MASPHLAERLAKICSLLWAGHSLNSRHFNLCFKVSYQPSRKSGFQRGFLLITSIAEPSNGVFNNATASSSRFNVLEPTNLTCSLS
jgi:hypothetical protein